MATRRLRPAGLLIVFLMAVADAASAQVDEPDPEFQDTNGDGIDGEVAGAVFVDAVGGNDTDAGTMSAPKRTLTAAIAAARTVLPVRDVYVSMGTYTEALSLASGVSLYGQFSRADGWQRGPLFQTRIQPGPDGILAEDLATETHLEAFVIQAATAAASGTSSYGVRVVGGGGLVVIRYNRIEAGFGQPGVDGTNGAPGADGVVGSPGGQGSCDSTTLASGGPGGTNACSFGGSGGPGGVGTGNGVAGSSGSGGTLGGPRGVGTTCSLTFSGCRCTPPSAGDGGSGDDGTPGAPGPGAGPPSGIGTTVDGLYVPASGSDGIGGGHGKGGGGGGGGGGQGGSCVVDGAGNGGGGGGAAGCAGGGGDGGQGGGGSFGVLVAESGRAVVHHNRLVTGSGGGGGRGGDGGAGGTGADGGLGGAACTAEVGAGGDGGRGGDGGNGGGGSGGTGGPSAGILAINGGIVEATGTENKYSLGPGGAGGAGGVPLGAPGALGLQQAGGPELAAPEIVITAGSVNEGPAGSAELVFTVMLTDPTDSTVAVDYATSDGQAQAGADYAARSGRITFHPWTSTRTITVPVLPDALDEPDETFQVTLGNPSGAAIAVPFADGTIFDDDAPPSVSVGGVTVLEGQNGQTTATFIVSLDAPSGRTVTVDYATADGTASAGSDYEPDSGTVTFAPGATAESIVVLVAGDTAIESNEHFFVDLTAAVGATVAEARGIGAIRDDDPPDLIFRHGFE